MVSSRGFAISKRPPYCAAPEDRPPSQCYDRRTVCLVSPPFEGAIVCGWFAKKEHPFCAGNEKPPLGHYPEVARARRSPSPEASSSPWTTIHSSIGLASTKN